MSDLIDIESCKEFCSINGIEAFSASQVKINGRKYPLSTATIQKKLASFDISQGVPSLPILVDALKMMAKEQEKAAIELQAEGATGELKATFDKLLMVANYSYSQVTVIGYVKQPPSEEDKERLISGFEDVILKEEISYLRIPDLPEPNGYFFTDRCIKLDTKARDVIDRGYEEYVGRMEAVGKKCKDSESWFVGKIAEYFKSTPTQRVKEVGWNQKMAKAICYLSPTMLKHEIKRIDEGAGAWDEILERVDYPEEFLAWIWILVVGEKASSQVCWIYGTGNDGKSTISRVLSKILKNVSCSVNEFKNQFTHSKFYRKRLACWNDSRDLNVVDDGIIFQVTGGDKGDIEEKGKSSFQGEHNCMILATSNYYPKIDVHSPAHLRRVLLISLSSIKGVDKSFFSDVNFEDALFRDRYKLLAKAKVAHDILAKRYFPADQGKLLTNVPLSEEFKTHIKEKSRNRFTLSAEKFFKDKLTLKEGVAVDELVLQKMFSQYQERKGITSKNAHPTMGYGFLKNLLLSKGCVDAGDQILGVSESKVSDINEMESQFEELF